jgi:hypothetical protein
MRSLAISLAIVVAMAAALFGLFHVFGVVDKVAGPIASSALGFITFVHDQVDKALSSGKSRVTPGIVPVDEFTIRWPWMLVYATSILVAIFELIALIFLKPGVYFASMVDSHRLGLDPVQLAVGLTAVMSLPTICWCVFLLGRWVGIRSARAGYWILPVSILLSRALELGLVYFEGPEERAFLMGYFNGALPAGAVLNGLGGSVAVVAGMALIGVWRGNRIRFGAYFNSLLARVSGATKNTLLAMTYEEARALTPKG